MSKSSFQKEEGLRICVQRSLDLCLRLLFFAFDIYMLFHNKILSLKSLFEGVIICVRHLHLILQQNLPANIFSYSRTKSSRRNICVKTKTKKFPYMLKSFFYYTFCSRFQVRLSFHENKKAGTRNSAECDFCPTFHGVPFSIKQWNNVN